jgi:hypothetical protein
VLAMLFCCTVCCNSCDILQASVDARLMLLAVWPVVCAVLLQHLAAAA